MISGRRASGFRLPEVEDVRHGHDAPDLPADPHEHGLAVEEQHLQDPDALALVYDQRFDIFRKRNGYVQPCKSIPGDLYNE